jgi:hypothetical protein
MLMLLMLMMMMMMMTSILVVGFYMYSCRRGIRLFSQSLLGMSILRRISIGSIKVQIGMRPRTDTRILPLQLKSTGGSL